MFFIGDEMKYVCFLYIDVVAYKKMLFIIFCMYKPINVFNILTESIFTSVQSKFVMSHNEINII